MEKALTSPKTPLNVPISPTGLQTLYEGTISDYTKLSIEIKQFIKRLLEMVEGPKMKMVIAMDSPLLMLMKIFEEEIYMAPTCISPSISFKGQNMKKKKLFEGTPPSSKKKVKVEAAEEKTDEPKISSEIINIGSE
ncbi:hypothetical protein V6N13_109227 [Hibiscus sabdariffa]|uniref:Uncharacterized protein n=1 Tax=Hibiscus sabdariffa TaxID=183260 RepID=A0ABR2FPN6_9ROSI